MRRDYLNVHVFEGRDWYSPESDRWLFFLALSEDLSVGRILSEKKYEVTGLSSGKKSKLCM